MSKPPKIVIPGLNRGIGVPPGYVLGRMPGTGKGPAQLLNLGSLRKLGVAGAAGVAQSTSTAISIAHSETVSLKTSVSTSLSQISSSLSGAISSTGSLSTAVSTVISGSISAVNSRVDSLSTAVGVGGGDVDDDTALSTSLSSAVSINTTQSTSLSQISSSLSGAISSTSSLSSAVSTVDSNQSTSLSQISSSLSAEISADLSMINSLSTAVGGGGGGGTSKVWDFMWGANNSASAGAFAFKGLRVIPRQTIVVDGLATDLVTPVNGATYVAYIVSMTSTTVINTVLGTSSTFTASGTSRINPLLFTFASGVTLTSGSAYSIIIGCTSSTGTTALPVPSTGTALRYTNAPLQNDGFVTLTTAPVNGATLTYGSTPDGYLTGVRWQTN